MGSYLEAATFNPNEALVPEGYVIFDGKMFAKNAVGNLIELADGVLRPTAKVCSIDGKSNHGVQMGIEIHGKQHQFIVKSNVVFKGMNGFVASLADSGVNISPSQLEPFKRYIQKSCAMPELPTKYTVNETGFISDMLAFVYGDEVFVGKSETENDNSFISTVKSASGLTAQGTFEDYSENVLKASVTPATKFAICAALSAPLAQLIGLEGGGAHIYGPSGSGKSTLLQAFASVMGTGAEPGDGSKESSILRWSSTGNSLEALSAERSGLGIAIDELGAFKGNKLSAVLYTFLSGKGKARLTSALNLAKQHKASVLLMSSGELSIEEKLRLSREQINAGLLARLPSIFISAEDMATEGETLTETASRIESYKDACATYGGTAGPLFIQRMLDRYENRAELDADVSKQWEDALAELANLASNSIQRRIIRKFALVLTAGYLAIDLNILPFTEEEIGEAVIFMLERCLNDLNASKTDAERAVDRLTDYLRKNYHKLPHSDEFDIKSTVEGYKHSDYLLLLPETFKRICQDVTPSQVGDELKKVGALKHDDGKQKYRVMLPCTEKRQYFYCIHNHFIDDILLEELEAELEENSANSDSEEPMS